MRAGNLLRSGRAFGLSSSPISSRWSRVQAPHEPIGIAPFRLALQDEGLGAEAELTAGARVGDLARRTSKVAASAWMRVSPKPTIVSGRRAITRTGTGSPPAGV